MKGGARSKFEVFLIAVVVLLTASLGLGLYRGRVQAEKGELLMRELSTIRSSIELYRRINGTFPTSLMNIVEEHFQFPDSTKAPYLHMVPAIRNGVFLDPFGHPYHYDGKTGWVQTTTEGYEKW